MGSNTSREKSVYLNLSNHFYNRKGHVNGRYLYTLIKFFNLEGYKVNIHFNPLLFYALYTGPYSRFIIKDNLFNIVFKKPQAAKLTICDNCASSDFITLSPNYFNELIKGFNQADTYHIPMAQHPNLYREDIWNAKVQLSQERFNSIFSAGNFDKLNYDSEELEKVFNVTNRYRIYRAFKNKEYAFYPSSYKDFNSLLDNGKLIFVNKENFGIPMDKLRKILSKFNFYFALPGVVMPFSHNIIEAMSVGTIPVIEKSYAKLFRPKLHDGKTALLFENIIDLQNRIKSIMNMSNKHIHYLRENVNKYYSANLTPHSVIKNLNNKKIEKAYLQSEHYAVSVVKNM